MPTYYIDYIDGSQILTGGEVAVENENIDVTNWTVGDPFILATLIFSAVNCSKNPIATDLKLQFQKDAEGFGDVGAATEIMYSEATDLVDDAVGTDYGITAPATCGGAISGPQECTDAAIVSNDIAGEAWTQIAWALDTDNATAESVYSFQVYSNSDTAACTNTTAIVTITMAAAPVIYVPQIMVAVI